MEIRKGFRFHGRGSCTAVAFALGALIASLAAGPASAWKPDRDVEIIAGAGPGGALDLTARMMDKIIRERKLLDVNTVVVNKAGGGGAVAWTYLNRNAGNAHHIAVVATSLITTPILGNSPADFRDLTPLAHMVSEAFAIGVNAKSPIKSGKELFDRLKADPASLSLALAPGFGSASHITFAEPVRAMGGDSGKLKTVAYNSAPLGITALLGGHVDALSTVPVLFAPHLQAGTMRAIALAADKRLTGLYKDVPTMKELGYDVSVENNRYVVGPRGLNADQIAFWDNLLAKVAATDEFKKHADGDFAVVPYKNSAQTRAFFEQENARYTKILTEMGLVKKK